MFFCMLLGISPRLEPIIPNGTKQKVTHRKSSVTKQMCAEGAVPQNGRAPDEMGYPFYNLCRIISTKLAMSTSRDPMTPFRVDSDFDELLAVSRKPPRRGRARPLDTMTPTQELRA
jgi:hypothetical protein